MIQRFETPKREYHGHVYHIFGEAGKSYQYAVQPIDSDASKVVSSKDSYPSVVECNQAAISAINLKMGGAPVMPVKEQAEPVAPKKRASKSKTTKTK